MKLENIKKLLQHEEIDVDNYDDEQLEAIGFFLEKYDLSTAIQAVEEEAYYVRRVNGRRKFYETDLIEYDMD